MKVAGFFAGVGGIELGFKQAGFEDERGEVFFQPARVRKKTESNIY